jgi:hypothetical protein
LLSKIVAAIFRQSRTSRGCCESTTCDLWTTPQVRVGSGSLSMAIHLSSSCVSFSRRR